MECLPLFVELLERGPVILRNDYNGHPDIPSGLWTDVSYPTGVSNPIVIPPDTETALVIREIAKRRFGMLN